MKRWWHRFVHGHWPSMGHVTWIDKDGEPFDGGTHCILCLEDDNEQRRAGRPW